MKKIVHLFIFFIGLTTISFAQTSNAIFFAENGERFQVVLNGVLQNSTPETNVKMTQLNADAYKVRILFEDKKLGYVDYNLYFQSMGVEATYNIKQNNKGNYVVRYVSEVPLAQVPPSTPQQNVVVYHATPAPAATTTTTTVQQTRSTTTGGSNGDNVNINIGMNVDGMGGGISINASGMDGDMGTAQSTTTTTTTHTVVTSSSSTTSAPAPATVVYVQGYNGPIGCPVPLSQNEFMSMKETIRSKDFENTKLTIAKQVLNNNCLTSAQVRDILGLFDFENTRLDYAKYAYGHTYDIGNYYKVNDAFQFESSIEELNAYINGSR